MASPQVRAQLPARLACMAYIYVMLKLFPGHRLFMRIGRHLFAFLEY